MSKLKILWVTEASFLSTGYSTYSREVLKRLHAKNKYDIMEMAVYCHEEDPRIKAVPWKVYANMPNPNNAEEIAKYNAHPINQFGAFKFEKIASSFRPNIVVIIRDVWMDSFVVTSPLRKYFNLLWMPTIDGEPQATEWLNHYSNCDALFTYSDWAIDVLKRSCDKLNVLGSAPPAADECFKPLNKLEIKKSVGLENKYVIGTVMRNQKRKLFPDLFQAFRKFLDLSGRDDVLLYCHTSYPDNHPWNIPELILEHGLSNKVLLTYKCSSCGYTHPTHFQDYVSVCRNCHNTTSRTSTVQLGISSQELVEIYNMFDIYIQYSNCEGFGMGQAEAAACGVPVMSVDYSAMSDVVRKLDGWPLALKAKYKELETGRMFAVPDNDYTANKLCEIFKLNDDSKFLTKKGIHARAAYLKNYSYNTTASKYEEYFDSFDINSLEQLWKRPFQQHKIDTNIPNDTVSNTDFAKWLFTNVLGESEKVGTHFYSKVLKDINYGCTTSGTGVHYGNDDSHVNGPHIRSFSRKEAFDQIKAMTEFKFYWEKRRLNDNAKT